MTPNSQRWLHRFAWLLAGATFLLIIAGATVTSNRAGLSVPDWPNTYGQFMFSFPLSKMVGGIFYEHGHRMLASVVGMLTIVLAVWLWFGARPTRLRWLGVGALAAVIAQGLLGGLTVLLYLPPPVSVAHAALAQAFFCITIAAALATAPRWSEPPAAVRHAPMLKVMALVTTLAVYAQLLLGATIRHADRAVLPHIIGAIVVMFAAIVAAMTALCIGRRKDFLAIAFGLTLLVLAQFFIGIVTLVIRQPKDALGQLTTLQIVMPTIHLAIGALILATSFTLALKSFRSLKSDGSRPPVPLGSYLELTKPRILMMVLVTTALGFFLGGKGVHSVPTLLLTLLGVGAATGGAAVLNNYLERDVDARMERTRRRALPAGVISPANALAYGITLVLAGLAVLVIWVNLLTGFLVLLAVFLYVLVYTPMKRLTWFNTTVGAIPGAIPPMCGWVAATGQLGVGGWVLFFILFAWQHPHFFAIAWMFKDDYREAGFKMLPVVEPDGRSTFRLAIIYSVVLLLVSILPTVIGMTGLIYFWGAIAMGLALLAVGIALALAKSRDAARQLLKASVIYLPLLLVLIIIDAGF